MAATLVDRGFGSCAPIPGLAAGVAGGLLDPAGRAELAALDVDHGGGAARRD